MSNKLGMDTELAIEVVRSVQGYADALGYIEDEVRLARVMSLNPLNFALNPGAMVLAPSSIIMAASVSADLTNVRNTLDYLRLKLAQEALQQSQVSNSLLTTDPGWFAQVPNAEKPEEVSIFDEALEGLGIVATVIEKAGLFVNILKTIDHWWDALPPGWKSVIKVVERGGKFVPILGFVASLASTILEWDPDNVWGNTRNVIGTVLEAGEVVAAFALIPPLTPAGAILEGVLTTANVAWNVMDIAWDLHDEDVWNWPWE